jgi:hypothetical protein
MPPSRWRIAGIRQVIEMTMMDFITVEIPHITDLLAKKMDFGETG